MSAIFFHSIIILVAITSPQPLWQRVGLAIRLEVGAMETAAPASRAVTTQRSAPASGSTGAASGSSGVNSSGGGAGGGGGMPHVHTLPLCSVRSMSVASISSEGSTESHGHGVEQEEIAALTQDVRNFKEALGHLRRVFHSDRGVFKTKSVLRKLMHKYDLPK
ncbi:hypothetical protein B566_EDAN012388 [Ephemera danica]|nr:hypothetical protein B566_EDAN012388 [Ephemera danica]